MDLPVFNYPTLPTFYNFSDASDDTLFQAYCLNPPADSCDFGPCPNLDVTGIGQQVSLSLSVRAAISLESEHRLKKTKVIMFIYLPRELRFTSYAYLANIYSLMISASVALKQQQLTQNDAIFTLIAISSPASFGHWILAFNVAISKYRKRAMIDHQIYGFGSLGELSGMAVLSLLSLLAWIVLICLVLTPNALIQFSQPACSKVFGGVKVFSFIWMSPFILHSVPLPLMFLFLRRNDSSLPIPSDVSKFSDVPDVNQWIFNKLGADYPKVATPSTLKILIFLVQFGAFPATTLYTVVALSVAVGVAGVVTYFRLVGELTVENSAHSFSWIPKTGLIFGTAWQIIIYIFGAIGLPVPMAYVCPVLSIPSILSIILLATTKAAKKWPKWIICLQSVIIAGTGSIIYAYPGLAFFFRDTYWIWYIFWVLAWQLDVLLPKTRGLSPSERRKVLKYSLKESINHAPILKFAIFVFGPSALWIQATAVANPTRSDGFTFGQIYSMIAAIASLIPILMVVWGNWKMILEAMWPKIQECKENSEHELGNLQAHRADASSEAPNEETSRELHTSSVTLGSHRYLTRKARSLPSHIV